MDTTPSIASNRSTLMLIGALILMGAIFVIDLQMPIVYAVGVLYVLVIILGLWIDWPSFPVLAAVAATALLIVDILVGWTETPPPFIYVNRPLMVLVYMTTAAIVMGFRRVEREATATLRQLSDFKRALDHAAIVATTDVTGRITYVNDKFVEISGYPADELIGQDHRIINSAYHPKEFIRDLWRTIASGRVWHGEIRNRARDGHFYWVDTTIVPFLNPRGKPVQYVAIRFDITARKAAEDRLAQQAALARVGQMAAIVAHEVRNPLAGIKGAIQVLMSRRPAGDSELPVMRDVITRIDSLGELINDLMVFARPRPPHPSQFAVGSLIEEALIMLRRDPIAAGVDVTVSGDARIEADAELVRATVLNLVLNAAQAMNGKGSIAITIAQQGREAVIEVRDSGPGIPEDIRDQIFEPFFTTKARGGGLGLPIARRTAELHGGALTCACPPGGGTVMTLTLPLAPSRHPAPDAGAPAATARTSLSDSAPGRG